MTSRRFLIALVIAAAGGTAVTSTQEGLARPLALVGGTLIDGGPGEPVRNSVVLIRGDRVEKVGTVESPTTKHGRRYR